MDTLCLIALIVVAVVTGKPLSYLKCTDIGTFHPNSSAYAFSKNLDSVLDQMAGKVVKYVNWIGAAKSVCLEAKAVWGLSVALWLVFPPPFLSYCFCGSCYE